MVKNAPKKAPAAVKPAAETEEKIKLYKAEMLLNISRTLAAFETLDEMLERLVEITPMEVGAERGTIFLNDSSTGELYSRVAQGNFRREIRILNNSGVAGRVFRTGRGMIVNDAYANRYFNPDIDRQTGYTTKFILCVPVKTVKGEIIGVAQALNKKRGKFDKKDLETLGDMTTQAAVVLQGAQFIEQMQKDRKQELEFMDVVSDITSEIDLGALLQKVMAEATRMLNAERSTLFLNDDKKNELFSLVGQGLETHEIRFPNHLGIAGAVFTTGNTVNIPYVDADLMVNEETLSVNVTILPLVSVEQKKLGSMVMIEDISSEKRMKSTMSRYMDPGLADQLLGKGKDILGGKSTTATVLFSDIRSFTTLTE